MINSFAWMRFYVIYFLLFLLFFSPNLVKAQDKIGVIEIVGLKKCKPDYLFKFVKCKPGDQLDSLELDQDIQRLRNLNGISGASYTVEKEGDEMNVTIKCREGLTLLPSAGFGAVKGNSWFKIGAFDVNLGGRGIIVKTYYQYNRRHSFEFSVRVPYIKEDKWGVLANFEASKFIEPLNIDTSIVFYNYDNIRAEVGGIYHMNEKQNIDFSFNYVQEEYAKREEELLDVGPESVDDEQVVLKMAHRLKFINYFEQYFSGWSNELVVQGKRSFRLNKYLYSVSNTTKYYKRFNKTNLAFRLKIGLSTNSERYFTPFVLDSYFNIRGVGNKIDRGTGTISLNSEVRQTLLENGFGAIQATAFTDIGSWRKSEGMFKNFTDVQHIKFYYGLGIRIIYKHAYKTSLRIDYGISLFDSSSRGLVLGVGQYF